MPRLLSSAGIRNEDGMQDHVCTIIHTEQVNSSHCAGAWLNDLVKGFSFYLPVIY